MQRAYRFHLERQEELAAQPVFALLLSQGHLIANVRRPIPGSGRSPDFILELDGEPVALEVVRYLDRPEAQQALSRVVLIEREIQDRLAPDAIAAQGKIVINIRYTVDDLVEHKRKDVQRDSDQLAQDVRLALSGASTDSPDLVDVPSAVHWIVDAQASVLPSTEPGVYFAIAPGFPDGAPDPDSFIERTIRSKTDQHVDHASRAILAVVGMFNDDAEDLRAAFWRWPHPVPWWRVYFVRYNAALVFEQPKGD